MGIRLRTVCMALLCIAALGIAPAAALGEAGSDHAATPRLAQGLGLYAGGHYAEAVSYFSGMLKEQPDNLTARYYMGDAYYRMGDFTHARQVFDALYRAHAEFAPAQPAGFNGR